MKLLISILLFVFAPTVVGSIIPIQDQRKIYFVSYDPHGDRSFTTVPTDSFSDFNESTTMSDQTSGLTSSSIYGSGYGYQYGPRAGTGSGGSSSFDITFKVDSNQDFNLVGTTRIELSGYSAVQLYSDGIILAEYFSSEYGSPSSTSFNEIFSLTTDNIYRLHASGGGADIDGGGYYDFQLHAVPIPAGTGKIGNFVWEDNNDNGVQDSGEPGLDGVTVKLRLDCNSATTQSMTTSNGGAFLFDGLPAGQYQLEFILPNGYSFSPSNADGDYNIDSNPDAAGLDACRPLAEGQKRLALDAGLVPDGLMDILMVINAIYYPNDKRVWIKAVSDALPTSAIITATGITNGVETMLGQVGWKADKMAYQQVFKNLASVPDTIRLNSHFGGMVTSAVEGGGGGSSADALTVLKAVYYTADNRLWIKGSSDATPAGSAVITASTVTSGVETVLGQVGWKPSKNAYQQVFMNIAQPDSVILNSNLGGTVAASIEVRQ